MSFETTIETVGKVGDGLGVGIIAAGFVVATVLAARDLRADGGMTVYKMLRQRIGRSILLGLEILVAADIIRTVAISPTLTSAGVLAIIVVIRSVLSLSLQVELEGRWPWQQRPSGPSAAQATRPSSSGVTSPGAAEDGAHWQTGWSPTPPIAPAEREPSDSGTRWPRPRPQPPAGGDPEDHSASS